VNNSAGLRKYSQDAKAEPSHSKAV